MMSSKESYILDFTHPISEVKTLGFQLNQEFWNRFDQSEITDGAVEATVTITPIRGLYEVTFGFSGEVTVPCDRCLAPLSEEVDTEETVTFELGDELNDENENVIILNTQDPTYDISDLMYEMIALSLPLQRMHDIEDCDPEMVKFLVGSAPEETVATEEKAEDPRWSALRKAVEKEK